MKAEIITIGDEILFGQIVDTNSAWLAQSLATLDIRVGNMVSISDNEEAIRSALEIATARSQLVIVTGGLGPTQDDVTKKTIADYFQTGLILDQDVLAHVKKLFEKYLGERDMPVANYGQAQVLACCEVLFNDVGTAPGMWVERDGMIYAFLPGVPFEMKFLMENRIQPKLVQRQAEKKLYHAHVVTVGLGESHLAEEIADIEQSLPPHIKLAYLPKIGLVRLRLTAKGTDEEQLKTEVEAFADRIAQRLQTYLVSRKDITFEEAIVEEFVRSGLRLATAESCTGGAIASRITQVAGASQIFDCGIVAYHNRIKMEVLGVQASTLDSFGAVSEQTVIEMAEGVKRLSGADYGVATSGIAGPSGGTPDKPVGTVWVAVAGKTKTITRKYQFHNARDINIERSVMQALTKMWMLYKEEVF